METQQHPSPADLTEDDTLLILKIRDRASAILGRQDSVVLRLEAPEIWGIFLRNLPPELRQVYQCRACRSFVERVGPLVSVDATGKTELVAWAPDLGWLPKPFQGGAAAVRAYLRDAQISGLFLTDQAVLGTPQTGEWHHIHAYVNERCGCRVARNVLPDQRAAEVRHEREGLLRALADFSEDLVRRTLILAKSGQLLRPEKIVPVLDWFLSRLEEAGDRKMNDRQREALRWRASALAPAGYCHLRGGVVGELLRDVAEGLPVEAVIAKHAARVDPSVYQRPSAAPTQGNVAEAERLFRELGIGAALGRRYARLEEIPAPHFLWQPRGAPKAKGAGAREGLFSHVEVKKEAPPPAPQISLPQQAITWEKFKRTVLPSARSIEALVTNNPSRLVALVTAEDVSAPPILQWDRVDHSDSERRPFSWYYRSGGIDAEIRRRVLAAGGQVDDCDVRASLSWENENDLDLHVLTPRGERVYYASKKSTCGGWLDVDANAGGGNPTPVENTRWKKGRAPQGLYSVQVCFFRRWAYGLPQATPFKLEIEVGGEVRRLSGTMTVPNNTTQITLARFEWNGRKVTWHGTGDPRAEAIAREVEGVASSRGWGLQQDQWTKVTGILPSPNLWGPSPLPQHGEHTIFLLEGCRDLDQTGAMGFHVETLRPELRPAHRTLEAHLRTAQISGSEQATACGLGMNHAAPWGLRLRVRTDDAEALYLIDRVD